MTTWNVVAAIAASLLVAGCAAQEGDKSAPRRLQQAGQPMDPLRTASHMAGARLAAVTGDQAGVQRNMEAMSEDMRRTMKMADAGRPINPEAARAIARAMSGVRSANWIDRANLLIRVDGAHLRSQQTIDELCYRLEPLGDTLAVVVHVQDAVPTDRDGMNTLSRNCQLAEGDHAFMQRARPVDVLDPGLRAEHRAVGELMRTRPPRPQTAGDREALEGMREM